MNTIKKVIRASAGTGKTYRLSLEFISILLKCRDQLNFSEILVITFTRKAAFEIRARIFSHLRDICSGNGQEIIANLEACNKGISIGQQELEYLKETYIEILTHKTRLNVSTIDSFITMIFTNLIAPYLNLDRITIDPEINQRYLPEIYNAIITEDNLEKFRELFSATGSRNLKNFDQMIIDILQYRWLLDGIARDSFPREDPDVSTARQEYITKLNILVEMFRDYLVMEQKYPQSPFDLVDLFKKDILEIIHQRTDRRQGTSSEIAHLLLETFTDEEMIFKHFPAIIKNYCFWDGSRQLKKKIYSELKEDLVFQAEQMQLALANWLLVAKALPEQARIRELAALIYRKYDEIKFRDRIFTYDDLNFYTYRYLYDPEISIIDPDNVLNLFYEFLSYRFRFLLIDEFQDTNIIQWNILSPLIAEITSGSGQKEYGGMIIVGDEKQSIYGWRGGEKKLLENCLTVFNVESREERLTTTYRCYPVVQDFLNKLFGNEYLHNRLNDLGLNWDYLPVNSREDIQGGYVEIIVCNQNNGEEDIDPGEKFYTDFIENVLKPQIETGKIELAKTAVLARKNKELTTLALLLGEAGIDYVLESTASIFQHRSVKPILKLLQFLAYNDLYDLLKFLRSDLVLLSAEGLGGFLRAIKKTGFQDYLKKSDIDPVFQRIRKINALLERGSILNIIKGIMEEFHVESIFHREIDAKNLLRFLEIAAEYKVSTGEYLSNICGFVQFCQENEKNEKFCQIGTSQTGSLNLLTIHKAKGLEFDTVFLLQELRARTQGESSALSHIIRYEDNYHNAADFTITMNYRAALENSRYKYLKDIMELSDYAEELNNIYVGTTRAKNELFMIYHYNSGKELPAFITDLMKNKKLKAPDLFFLNLYQLLNDEFIQQGNRWICRWGNRDRITEKIKQNDEPVSISPTFFDYFSFLTSDHLEKNVMTPGLSELYHQHITGKNLLIGNIVHFYLAQIKFDHPAGKSEACNKTIAAYGNLMDPLLIRTIIAQVNRFITENSKIFSEDCWDTVYNEYTVFDQYDLEYRIDRMMINRKEKKIFIVDYKTGSIFDRDQMEKYKEIVKGLTFVREQNYAVDGNYIEVKINPNQE